MKTVPHLLLALVLVILTATEGHTRNITSTPAELRLSSPPNGAIINSLSATLVWEKLGDNALYWVEVSTKSDFTSLVYQYRFLKDTRVSISHLVDGTTYFWRVSADNVLIKGTRSSVWNFKCQIPPLEVKLVSPSNGSTVTTCTTTLAWKQNLLATQYTVQVATDNNFAFPFYSAGNGTATQVSISGLKNGTTYSWRVQMTYGILGRSYVVWSPTWSFLSQIPPPNPPPLLSPTNGSIINGFSSTLTATLKWGAVQDAAQYSIDVSNTSQFPKFAPFFSATTSGNTQTSVSGIVPGTTYYWRVKTQNRCGDWGGWSSSWSFKYFFTPISPTVKP
jgi:hypothetical protein